MMGTVISTPGLGLKVFSAVSSVLNGVSHTPFRYMPFTSSNCVCAEMASVVIKSTLALVCGIPAYFIK
jgi:hypothetical protein